MAINLVNLHNAVSERMRLGTDFVIYDYATDAKSFTPAVGGMGIGSV